MTLPYELNPMPHQVEITCPACGERACFEFAEIVQIDRKKDIPFFEASDQFDYICGKGHYGQTWHGALFYPGLHGSGVGAIRELPEGYTPSNWEHPRYLRRSSGPKRGSVDCRNCHHQGKRDLSWPADAFYQIEYKGHLLWAFHEESARELLDFIESSHRDFRKFKWRSFLMKIPGHFLSKKSRDQVSKRLRKRIEAD